MNLVILMGHITNDLESKYLPDGKKYLRFGLAINNKYKNKNGEIVDQTEFLNCIAWGKQAEFIEKYFKKGSNILVEGKLKVDVSEKDGEKRYYTNVIVIRPRFAGYNKEQGTNNYVNNNDEYEPIPPSDDEFPF